MPFCNILISVNESSTCSISQDMNWYSFFKNRYVVVTHCGFTWHVICLMRLSIFFLCLLATHVSFMNIMVCPHLSPISLLAYLSSHNSSFYVRDMSPIYVLGIFSPSMYLFQFLKGCPLKNRSFKYWWMPFYQYFLLWVVLFAFFLRDHCLPQVNEHNLLSFLLWSLEL